MSVETTRWQVGVVGVTADVISLCERMSLQPAIRLAGVFDADPEGRRLIAVPGTQEWDQLDRALLSPEVDVLILSGACDEEIASRSLAQNKNLILTRPTQLSSAALRRLNDLAKSTGRLATVASHGRWSSSFLTALEAKLRLGSIQSIRSLSFEQSAPDSVNNLGVLRDFGYERFDQLLQLSQSKPIGVFARQAVDARTGLDHGLLAIIEFANGCRAQIEIQTRSRLSLHTGWMLEGTEASYRNNRLYTTMADGEIVDEPRPIVNASFDQFIEAMMSAWQGQPSKLPSLEDAAQVLELIETIQQTATKNSQ